MPNLFEEIANRFFKRRPSQDEHEKKPFGQESVMTDEDLERAEALLAECHAVEREQIWLPMHAGCAQCHGFVFACAGSAVTRQFGVCGCVVANEMELANLTANTGSMTLNTAALSGGFIVPKTICSDVAEVIQCASKPPEPLVKEKRNMRAATLQRNRHFGVVRKPHLLGKNQRVVTKTQRLGQRGR